MLKAVVFCLLLSVVFADTQRHDERRTETEKVRNVNTQHEKRDIDIESEIELEKLREKKYSNKKYESDSSYNVNKREVDTETDTESQRDKREELYPRERRSTGERRLDCRDKGQGRLDCIERSEGHRERRSVSETNFEGDRERDTETQRGKREEVYPGDREKRRERSTGFGSKHLECTDLDSNGRMQCRQIREKKSLKYESDSSYPTNFEKRDVDTEIPVETPTEKRHAFIPGFGYGAAYPYGGYGLGNLGGYGAFGGFYPGYAGYYRRSVRSAENPSSYGTPNVNRNRRHVVSGYVDPMIMPLHEMPGGYIDQPIPVM